MIIKTFMKKKQMGSVKTLIKINIFLNNIKYYVHPCWWEGTTIADPSSLEAQSLQVTYIEPSLKIKN